MATACGQNSSTSGRGMFGSRPHPKPCFGCLHGETSLRGYRKTWDVHDTQTLISLSFFALPCINEHHRIAAMIVMDLPFDLLPHNKSSISRVQIVVWILFCASQCPAFIS